MSNNNEINIDSNHMPSTQRQSVSEMDRDFINAAINGSCLNYTGSVLKRKSIDPDDNDEQQDGDHEGASGSKSKAKKPRQSSNNDSEISFYVYILVPKSASTCTAASSRKPPSDKFKIEAYVQSGPFSFLTSSSYEEFLDEVSTALQCDLALLQPSKLKYKFKTPQNSPMMSLGTDVAFNAFMNEIPDKTPAKCDIFVISEPPKKVEESEQYWNEASTFNNFDYQSLEIEMPSMALAAQKKKFDDKVAPERHQLEEKYPINNFGEIFPGKQIYKATSGHYWELTPLALSNWASHIVQGSATLDQPPETFFFDFKSHVLPSTSHTGSSNVVTAPTPSAPTVAPSVAFDPMQMLMLQSQQMMQMQMGLLLGGRLGGAGIGGNGLFRAGNSLIGAPGAFGNGLIGGPGHGLASIGAMPSLPSSPQKDPVPAVALAAFCDRYGIDDSTKCRLDELGYTPGNRVVTSMTKEYWGSNGVGFTVVGWLEFLEHHKRFLCDIKGGLWSD
ncbi:hypothetical protein GYMLUDRAFT_65109 [Collybiopsis luxurians FD-317 M1]|uniref:Uncharacterized protein n=1 Tax=Collybiopsis luxurians FD-317 M1 TaxID=944289 RepID=A0A0D0BN06_9AGAR|nr:hypothetical protein GYMLUDRAFT_65109 [Collybiopsis luxurians FD-317 M1]